MKEATGELSTTVITIVAIAAISTLFIAVLYPRLKTSIQLNQACNSGPGYKDDTVCCGLTGGNSNQCQTGNKSKVCNAEQDAAQQFTCYLNEKD